MTDVLQVAESDVMELMFDKGWTDGLPVVPPTPDKVAAMLAGAGRDADEVLGSVPARRRTIDAQIVAINAVMAGCKPEYFPIVVGALEAVLDPTFNVNTVATSTGGAAICVMVSGPMADEVGMNGRHNALGTGNRANATIGRAVRLTVANALGAKTGKLDASSVGHPGKYTFCFAERPPAAPWQPLQVEKGYLPEDTTVTIMATEGPRQVANHLNETPEGVLLSFAAAMKTPSNFIAGKRGQVDRRARPRTRARRPPGGLDQAAGGRVPGRAQPHHAGGARGGRHPRRARRPARHDPRTGRQAARRRRPGRHRAHHRRRRRVGLVGADPVVGAGPALRARSPAACARPVRRCPTAARTAAK